MLIKLIVIMFEGRSREVKGIGGKEDVITSLPTVISILLISRAMVMLSTSRGSIPTLPKSFLTTREFAG